MIRYKVTDNSTLEYQIYEFDGETTLEQCIQLINEWNVAQENHKQEVTYSLIEVSA